MTWEPPGRQNPEAEGAASTSSGAPPDQPYGHEPDDPDHDDHEPYRPQRGWIRVVAVIAILGLVGVYGLRPAQQSDEARRPAPIDDFRLPLLGGTGAITSDDLRGRPAVVNLWASWCDPCRREMPILSELAREYRSEGVLFLGVDVMDAEMNALEFLEDVEVSYPTVTDPEKIFTQALGVTGLPVTLFLRPEEDALDHVLGGNIEQGGTVHFGELEEATIRAEVEAMLE